MHHVLPSLPTRRPTTMIQELKSERVLILLVICVLAAQIPHAQGVWYHASAQTLLFDWAHLWTWCCAWLFAFGLEFSTLMQVIRGRHLLSYLFALISVCINLFYFQIVNDVGLTDLATRYWLLSVILPLAIASYSHLCAAAANAPRAHVHWVAPHWIQAVRQRLRRQEVHPTTQPEQSWDERERAVIAAVESGATSINAISRATQIGVSALRRKNRRGKYTGLVHQLIQAGVLADESGTIVMAQ